MREHWQRLWDGLGRVAMAVLLVLLGIWAPLHAIGPALTWHTVEVLPTTDDDPAKPAVLAALAAYRPNGPPAGIHSHINRSPNPGTRVAPDGEVWVIVVVTFRADHSAVANWYAYAGGDPVNRWDPTGLDWVWNGANWEWDGIWGDQRDVSLDSLPAYVQMEPPAAMAEVRQRVDKEFYDTSVQWRAYYVARQFAGDNPEVYAVNRRRFQRQNLGHAFLMTEWSLFNTTTVDATYSWHPYVWPRNDPTAPLTDVRGQFNNIIDGNESRRGRIWKNDPTDMTLAVEAGPLAHHRIRIGSLSSREGVESLKRYISDWVGVNDVGFDFGPAQDIRDPWFPENTLGQISMRPRGSATMYWVYGQNCFWWASLAIDRVSPEGMSQAERASVERYNFAIGTRRRFTHNDRVRLDLAARRNWLEKLFDPNPMGRAMAMRCDPLTPLVLDPGVHYDINPLDQERRALLDPRRHERREYTNVDPVHNSWESILEALSR